MSVDSGIRSWAELFASRVDLGPGIEISSFIGHAGQPGLIAFSGGFPDPVTFDVPHLQELVGGVLADPAALQYGATAGMAGLRDWLSGWIDARDGGQLAEDELMITSGGMEGLTLLNLCLVDPGDRVLVEGPTFMGALAAIKYAQAQPIAVAMDEQGLDTDDLERVLASGGRVKYLYVISDFQNPTGRSLSTPRRHALIELARRYGFLIVEDVAYRELGFDDERLPSLRTLAPDVVVQLGTFAKTFMPGLRLGWMAGPAELLAQVLRAKQYTDQCASPVGQRLLEEFGRSGGFDRSLLTKREFYRARCEIMMSALAEHLPAEVSFTRPTGGFFSWLTAPAATDTSELPKLAMAEGVAFLPGQIFYPDGRGGNELRLAFSKVPEDQIAEGIRRLGTILHTLV